MHKLTASLSGVLLLSSFAAAQDPVEILKKTATAYRAITSIDMEVVDKSQSQSATSKNENERRQRIAAAGSKYRMEDLAPAHVLQIFDGQTSWQYSLQNNEYVKQTMPARRAGAVPQYRPYPISQYENIAQRVKSARILRQETLEVSGAVVSCFVIEVEREEPPRPEPPAGQAVIHRLPEIYWIDMSRGLVLKSVDKTTIKTPNGTDTESGNTQTVSKLAVDQPLPDSLFQFTPPEGAVQVERLSFAPKSPQLGKDLPFFELKGLDGKVVTSASLRGNIAVLHFGYSMAFDDTLPFLELLHRAYKGEGVSVLYVMRPQGEFARQGYTLPIAIDENGAAARQLGIGSGILVTDRLGKIVYLLNGSSSATPMAIVKELQKAELW